VCFIVAIEFAFVFTVGIAAMNRRNPVFGVPFSGSISGHRATVKGVSDVRIADAFVSSKKDMCPSDRLSTPFPVRDE
jgi:hypothetical protein